MSKKLGLAPDTLAVVLADSTVARFHYNFKVLIEAMLKVGLVPSEALIIQE